MGQGYQECTRGDVEFLKEKYIILLKNISILLNFFQLLLHVGYIYM